MKCVSVMIVALSCLLAVPAQAGVNVSSGSGTSALAVSTPYTVNFNGIGGNPVITIPGLNSALTLTFTGTSTVAGNSVYSFNYSIANSSSLSGARLSSFGFNVDPNVKSVSVTGGFDTGGTNVNYPVGFGKVDVCFYDGPQGTCTGNGNGVFAPNSTSGTLALTFNGLVSDITLSDFVDRYQGFDYQGIQSAIGIQSSVPEPATWGMMILGIGLAGGALRRKRQAVAVTATA